MVVALQGSAVRFCATNENLTVLKEPLMDLLLVFAPEEARDKRCLACKDKF